MTLEVTASPADKNSRESLRLSPGYEVKGVLGRGGLRCPPERGCVPRPQADQCPPHGRPKISNFGLARRLGGDPGLTWMGTVVGTPSYMAPEQARGKSNAIGPVADIYSQPVAEIDPLDQLSAVCRAELLAMSANRVIRLGASELASRLSW